MYRMASRSTKGGPPKTPNEKSTTSSIRSFMIKDDTPRLQGAKQQQIKKDKEKKTENRKPQSEDSRETSIETRGGGTESDSETSRMDQQRSTTHALSKEEMCQGLRNQLALPRVRAPRTGARMRAVAFQRGSVLRRVLGSARARAHARTSANHGATRPI